MGRAVPILPALLLDHLNGGAVARPKGDLPDLAGSLHREAASPEHVLDRGDVPLHLAHRTEPDLTQDQHIRVAVEVDMVAKHGSLVPFVLMQTADRGWLVKDVDLGRLVGEDAPGPVSVSR